MVDTQSPNKSANIDITSCEHVPPRRCAGNAVQNAVTCRGRVSALERLESEGRCCHPAGRKTSISSREDCDMAATVLQSTCHCRRVVINTTLSRDNADDALKCQCCHCRRHHTSAFVCFIRASKSRVSVYQGSESIVKVASSCKREGNVARWCCSSCSSKLLTECDGGSYLVNLGPMIEDTIPQQIAAKWRGQFIKEEDVALAADETTWYNSFPERGKNKNKLDKPPTDTCWTGSCSCGTSSYEIDVRRVTQLQHCYCHLCRELSGSAFMTWCPIDKSCFRWVGSGSIQLVRTTDFGRRHICSKCRGVLTIVYDSQPGLIWPCAGSLDDDSLPATKEEMGKYLSRVCHICCRHSPTWLRLPDDGMERLEDAC